MRRARLAFRTSTISSSAPAVQTGNRLSWWTCCLAALMGSWRHRWILSKALRAIRGMLRRAFAPETRLVSSCFIEILLHVRLSVLMQAILCPLRSLPVQIFRAVLREDELLKGQASELCFWMFFHRLDLVSSAAGGSEVELALVAGQQTRSYVS